jgi:trypsin
LRRVSFISRREVVLILVTLNCSWNYNIDLFAVRAGSADRRSGGQYVQAAYINVHPNWSYDTIFNDIAIVKLRTNLVYGAGVQPINLPPAGLYVPSPTPMQVSGWGQLASDGPQPYIVQTVVIPMVGMATCQAAYGVARIDPNIQVCAGEEGRSVCGGDSGGGLIYDNQVIGTVSWYCKYCFKIRL